LANKALTRPADDNVQTIASKVGQVTMVPVSRAEFDRRYPLGIAGVHWWQSAKIAKSEGIFSGHRINSFRQAVQPAVD